MTPYKARSPSVRASHPPLPHLQLRTAWTSLLRVGSKRGDLWVGVQCPLVAPRGAGRVRKARPDGCDSGVAPLQDGRRPD